MSTLKSPCSWSEKRLAALFDRYNRRFWNMRLPRWPVRDASLKGAWGQIVVAERVIRIDVTANRTDVNVRSTLLHEMAHLAGYDLEGGKVGHNSAFFTHVERLLKLGAPIRVSSAENQRRLDLDSVPRRFRRCRAAMRSEYDEAARWREKSATAAAARGAAITTLDLSEDFYELGKNGIRWPNALLTLDTSFGLLDIDDKPLPRFAKLEPAWRRAHRRGLREGRVQAEIAAFWASAVGVPVESGGTVVENLPGP